jgi:hypothetical protein
MYIYIVFVRIDMHIQLQFLPEYEFYSWACIHPGHRCQEFRLVVRLHPSAALCANSSPMGSLSRASDRPVVGFHSFALCSPQKWISITEGFTRGSESNDAAMFARDCHWPSHLLVCHGWQSLSPWKHHRNCHKKQWVYQTSSILII